MIVQNKKKEINPPIIQINNAFMICPLISCPKPGMKKEINAGIPCLPVAIVLMN
jgi:hypothetical protein